MFVRLGQIGVYPPAPQHVGELREAVVGVDLLRLDPLDHLQQFVEVGVVGQGQGVVHAVTVVRAFAQRPPAHHDPARPVELGDEPAACHLGRGDEDAALGQLDRTAAVEVCHRVRPGGADVRALPFVQVIDRPDGPVRGHG